MNNTLQNFKKLTLDNLNISLAEYLELQVIGKLKVYNQLAPNDISRAIQIAITMSDDNWEELKGKINTTKVTGWNLAIYVLLYDFSVDDNCDELQDYLDTQY